MPKYLVQANYVGEAITELLAQGGSSRRACMVRKLYPEKCSPHYCD